MTSKVANQERAETRTDAEDRAAGKLTEDSFARKKSDDGGNGSGTDSTDKGNGAKRIDIPPEQPHEQRFAAIVAARNPLLEAAQPLLRALADLPMVLDHDRVPVLREMLGRELTSFNQLCHRANIRHEHVVAASYTLCTAIDEAAQRTPWGGSVAGDNAGSWADKQLAQAFHTDNKGGTKVFLLVGRLAANPQEHMDLLELAYLVLGLGFEGRYPNEINGRRQLEDIRQRLLVILSSARGEVPAELSPHWHPSPRGRLKLVRTVPVWVSALVLGLALLGLFGWYKYRLGQMQADLTRQIAGIGQLRPAALPAQAAVNPLRLKALLADEIRRGTVAVDETDVRSAVAFKGDDMFVPGRAQITDRMRPVLRKVAEQVADVTGAVVVTGHTDAQPIHTREFPDNQALSEKRAQALADLLASAGVAPRRIRVEGKGDTVPLMSNATAAGRAKNRRVDLVVTTQSTSP